MKILGIYDGSGPKYFRIYLPLILFTGIEFNLASKLADENAAVDVVFLNRLISQNSLNEVLELKKKYGFKLITDFDDHWILDPSHLLFQVYKRTRASELMQEYIKVSDAVFVTHERLYDEAVKLNKNCFIFPNAIPKAGQFLFKKQPDKDVRFFWAGGVTHRNDIVLLKSFVRNISRPGIKFVMGGYEEKNSEWKTMASDFTDSGRVKHEVLRSLKVNEYYANYSKCDVALIPLVENSFNIYKSNLKILEAANIGSPVIVSRVNPYLGFPEDLVNYVDSQKTWYLQGKKLIESHALRKEQGERLKEYCDLNFNFNKINEERKQVLEYVIKRENRKIQAAV
jgi:glycosyltransferase involved in cell wall biosynthesis